MSAVERQELLDAATPRPWRVEERVLKLMVYGGKDGRFRRLVVENDTSDDDAYDRTQCVADTDLIVRSVNEYEALLACEAGLRAIVGFLQPTSRYALHAREALELLDRVREIA